MTWHRWANLIPDNGLGLLFPLFWVGLGPCEAISGSFVNYELRICPSGQLVNVFGTGPCIYQILVIKKTKKNREN